MSPMITPDNSYEFLRNVSLVYIKRSCEQLGIFGELFGGVRRSPGYKSQGSGEVSHELIYTFFFQFVEVIEEQVGEVIQGVLRSPEEPGLARRPVCQMIQKVKKSTGAREIITSNYTSTSSLQTSKILPGPPRGSPEPGFSRDYYWECPHELPICAGFLASGGLGD